LVVTTDHGFLLGEHDWWAKNIMPCYNEVAHIPLFIHHPDFASQAGSRRQLLTQTMDIMPTLMDIFGAKPPAEVTASSLLPALGDASLKNREACIYGVFGSAVNVTDGQYTYFIYPPDIHGGDLNQYTLMPLHMKEFFSIEELQEAKLIQSMPFSRSAPVLQIPATPKSPFYSHQGPATLKDTESALFDLHTDPLQNHPLHDAALEERMRRMAVAQMKVQHAPAEYFRRLDLSN
jgi:hypothetical protein